MKLLAVQSPDASAPKKNSEARPVGNGWIQVGQKLFLFDLRRNENGEFLKIIQMIGYRRNMIVIPASGLPQFLHSLNHMISSGD
jgi:hypothetical protein